MGDSGSATGWIEVTKEVFDAFKQLIESQDDEICEFKFNKGIIFKEKYFDYGFCILFACRGKAADDFTKDQINRLMKIFGEIRKFKFMKGILCFNTGEYDSLNKDELWIFSDGKITKVPNFSFRNIHSQ